jgi:hypothetical protein
MVYDARIDTTPPVRWGGGAGVGFGSEWALRDQKRRQAPVDPEGAARGRSTVVRLSRTTRRWCDSR